MTVTKSQGKRTKEEEKNKVKVAQSCPTLCNPMDYTVHGIPQARILEGVAVLFSRASSQPRIKPRSPTLQADSLPAEPLGKPKNTGVVAYPSPGYLPDPGIELESPALQADSLSAELLVKFMHTAYCLLKYFYIGEKPNIQSENGQIIHKDRILTHHLQESS